MDSLKNYQYYIRVSISLLPKQGDYRPPIPICKIGLGPLNSPSNKQLPLVLKMEELQKGILHRLKLEPWELITIRSFSRRTIGKVLIFMPMQQLLRLDPVFLMSSVTSSSLQLFFDQFIGVPQGQLFGALQCLLQILKKFKES